jgi:hypothetical protein
MIPSGSARCGPRLALLEVRIDKAEYWDEPLRENVKIGTLAPQHQA